MPGRSRSLLQFPGIKQEFTPVDSAPAVSSANMDNARQNVDKIMTKMVLNADSIVTTDKLTAKATVSTDHDYFFSMGMEKKKNNSYIEADAEPQGYGPGKVKNDNNLVERRVNVTGGRKGSMRTVVLHVPKDIK